MTEKYNILSPRQGKEKTWWMKIGTAIPKEGKFSIFLDALPLPDKDGKLFLMMSPAEDKNVAGQVLKEMQKPIQVNELDDEVPF